MYLHELGWNSFFQNHWIQNRVRTFSRRESSINREPGFRWCPRVVNYSQK